MAEGVEAMLRQSVKAPRVDDIDRLPESLGAVARRDSDQLALRVRDEHAALVVEQVRNDDGYTLALPCRGVRQQMGLARVEQRRAVEGAKEQAVRVRQTSICAVCDRCPPRRAEGAARRCRDHAAALLFEVLGQSAERFEDRKEAGRAEQEIKARPGGGVGTARQSRAGNQRRYGI
jgi:hypothetical protein